MSFQPHAGQREPPRYDYIVVGGGAAGCVLAGRLSQDPGVSVLLIEAGPDFDDANHPDSVTDAGFRAHYTPEFFTPPFDVTVATTDTGRRQGSFKQPWVIGGGSSVNGMHAQRGTPADYDAWKGLGVEGWGWDDVLPYFRRCETDHDFPRDEYHGDEGPISIARVPEAAWSGLALALRSSLGANGIPPLADMNAPTEAEGAGAVPLNIDGDRRCSTPLAYLTDAVRRRPNLRILPDCEVRRLLADGRDIVGVEVRGAGGLRRIHSRETILSAGAIRSPSLLLRSGIGPASDLRACGIEVLADRKGVGRRLRNHVHLSFALHVRRAGRMPSWRRPPCALVARYSSRVRGCEPTDMVLNLWDRLPGSLTRDPLGRQMATLMLLANKTHSVGEIKLDPQDGFGAPLIDFNILSDPRDIRRMVLGLQLIQRLLSQPEVAAHVNAAFLPLPGRLMRWLTQDGLRASLLSNAGGAFFNMSDSISRMVLGSMGPGIEDLARNERDAERAILDFAQPASHVTTTCRMGSPDDPEAVTDSRCRVIGVNRLRVVDCSIFPTPLRAGTHLPVIMAAEKAAAMIAQDDRPQAGLKVEAAHA